MPTEHPDPSVSARELTAIHPVVNRPDRIPLAYAQESLWIFDRLKGGSQQYNMGRAVRLLGDLNYDALTDAVNTIVERHESLRTRFAESAGEPEQIIDPHVRIHIPLIDLSSLSEDARQLAVEEARRSEKLPFDLERAPLLRLRLLKLREREHVLLWTVHHIIFDGASSAIFSRELQVLYDAFSQNLPNPLRPLDFQYADFSLWQRDQMTRGLLDESVQYWKRKLNGIPERLDLPGDSVVIPSSDHTECERTLPRDLTVSLRSFNRANNLTLYTTMLTAFAVLLWRTSGTRDIAIGSPIANRSSTRLEELIGLLLNTMILRVKVDTAGTFRDLLSATRETVLEAYDHQSVPFEVLVQELAPRRNLTAPFLQVHFAFQNLGMELPPMRGLKVEWIFGGWLQPRTDLEVYIFQRQDRIRVMWLHNASLFEKWRIEQLASHYLLILEAIVTNSEQRVCDVELLGLDERRRILEQWNDTLHSVSEAIAPDLFSRQADRTPDSLAVVFQDHQVTYGMLNARANQWARRLMARGVKAEDVVAVALNRSVDLIIAIWGILKSGAAYLLLDPDYPASRIEVMVQTSRPALVLTSQTLNPVLPPGYRTEFMDAPLVLEELAREEKSAAVGRDTRALPKNVAYVIFTSGSSGTPKVVAVTHDGIPSVIGAVIHHLELRPGSRLLQLAPLSFDMSFCEIAATHLSGSTLVLPMSGKNAGDDVLQLIRKHSITHFTLPPSRLRGIACEPDLPIETLSIGGEICPSDVLALWSAGRRVVNGYGQTETTVNVTMSKISSPTAGSVIGRPIWNMKAYVLDSRLNPVPPGINGELYVAGPALARGYVAQPGLTAQTFIANPFGGVGERMYRTGDFVRWQPDGGLEFHGRADDQVKLRGFRVELAEVEAAIRGRGGVGDAAVTVIGNEQTKRLAAYVVPMRGEPMEVDQLRRELAAILPEHMVPTVFVVVERLPLTSSGKLDRKALKEPDVRPSSAAYRVPRTPQEEILCRLFAEALEVDRVGIDDNFFDLGGQSLSAVRFVSRVRAQLGIDVNLDMLFEFPTVAQISSQTWKKTERPPLQPRQSRQ
jgi:amino acid adenylation domain-containing protein